MRRTAILILISALMLAAANGGGVAGATLSELAALPEGAPPMSYLLAAWVMRYGAKSCGYSAWLVLMIRTSEDHDSTSIAVAEHILGLR